MDSGRGFSSSLHNPLFLPTNLATTTAPFLCLRFAHQFPLLSSFRVNQFTQLISRVSFQSFSLISKSPVQVLFTFSRILNICNFFTKKRWNYRILCLILNFLCYVLHMSRSSLVSAMCLLLRHPLNSMESNFSDPKTGRLLASGYLAYVSSMGEIL